MKRSLLLLTVAVVLGLGCNEKKDDPGTTPTPTPTVTPGAQSCTNPGSLTQGVNGLGGVLFTGNGTIDPAGDADFYTHDMSAGDWVGVYMDANQFNDPSLLDAVVTLFDADGSNQLAQNDDDSTTLAMDSRLFYRAETDGTVCIQVADANAGGEPGFTYDIAVVPIDFSLYDEFNLDAGNNDTTGTAQLLTTTAVGNNQPYTQIAGVFDGGADLDVYRFDTDVGTIFGSIYFTPEGTSGHGSTVTSGVVRVYEPDGTTVLAELNPAMGATQIYAPLQASASHFVEVAAPIGGNLGANPFYFQELLALDAGNDPEVSEVGNDDPATPDVAPPYPNPQGVSHFIGGVFAGTDTDWWSYQANVGDTIVVACSSWRVGSGVRDMTVSVYQDTGTPLKTGTENETTDILWTGNDAVPVTIAGTHYISISASTFALNVSSRHYLCGIHVLAP